MITADQIYKQADTQLATIPKEEIYAWLASDVTKALLLKLEGDRTTYCELWMNGTFSGDTADKTVQLNSRALGVVQCNAEITNWIETLLVEEEE